MKVILQKSPVAMLISTGEEQRVVMVNQKFTELFGYSLEDIPDVEHWWPLAYPDEKYRDEVKAEWNFKIRQAARDHSDIEPVEAMVTCKDGSRRFIRGHMSPIGAGTRNLVTFFDITERRREQLAFSESEQRYQELFESSRDGIALVDHEGRYLDCNPAFCEMLGYTLPELKEMKDFYQITGEKWRVWEREEIFNNRLLTQGFSGVYEKEYIRKDGTVFPAEKSAFAVRDEAGEIKYYWSLVRDITVAKSVQNALQESENRFRLLFENIDEVFVVNEVITDDAGNPVDLRYIDVNPAFEKLLGMPRAEVIGKTRNEIMAVPDPETIQAIASVGLTGKINKREYYSKGAQRWYESFSYPTGDRMVATLVIDITDRKLAVEALRESETRYRTLVDMADDAILLTAPDGRILTANPAATRMFGCSEAEICRQGRAGLVVPDEKMQEAVARRDETGAITAELNMYRGDGTTFPVDVSSVVFETADGEKRTSMIIRDITERKRAEKALDESETRYRGLFEDTKDMIVMTTPDGKVLDMNPAGIELLGYASREEALRELDNARKYYAHPEDREPLIAQLRRYGYIRDVEIDLRRKDGEMLPVSASFTPTLDENGEIVVLRGIFRDISERRLLENELRQSQKMESVGRLAGGIAHYFNNLLTSIQGYIDLTLMKLPDDSPLRSELIMSRTSCQKAADIARELLIFSRQHMLQLESIALNQLIRDHVSLLGSLIGEQYHLKLDLQEDLWSLSGEPAQLQQVIMKLVLNAQEAMPQGGEIAVSTANVTIDGEYASNHPGSRLGEFVRLAIKDSGIGMNSETLSHLFEPFFTTKGLAASSGLGLSVTDGIIAQHKGWIEVESAPGQGTTFNIFIPAVLSPEKPPQKKAVSLEELQGQGEKILLVEDEEAVRTMAVRMLSQNGYAVTAAASAEEAAGIFTQQGGDFQLVFSDVVLPGEDGVSLTEALVKQRPALKVLLTSGYSDVDRQEIIDQQYPFLTKPYSLLDTLQKVAELLRGGTVNRD